MTSGQSPGRHLILRVANTVGPWTPLAALAFAVLAVTLGGDGDIRRAPFAYSVALACVCLALTSLAVRSAHQHAPSRSISIGSVWAALAFLGIAGFFAAVGTGGLLGIPEDAVGAWSLLPVVSMAFGLLSMAPALTLLEIGAWRSRQIPARSRAAIFTAAPVLPSLLVFGGLAEGTAETVGTLALLLLFLSSWILIGSGLRTPAGNPPSPIRSSG